jgi:polyisoprenoid-binding protein YceI
MTVTKWTLDLAHSEVQFKIKHLMISTVTGSFKKIDATVETKDNDFTNAEINFAADVDSVDTNSEDRDKHLKTPDFFDAADYPKILFESSQMKKIDDENYKLYGSLIIKDISKPVVLDVEFGGIVEKDRFGNTKAGFSFNGKINRRDFGIGPINPALGDEIKLNGSVQIVKQV